MSQIPPRPPMASHWLAAAVPKTWILETTRSRIDARAAAATAGSTTAEYLGIGMGVGGAIFIAIVVLVVQIIRKRREYRKSIAYFESERGIVSARDTAYATDYPRPVSVPRSNTLVPLRAHGGWNALSSDETVNEPEPARPRGARRQSISLPKRIRQKSMPLSRIKHLSAIIESPRVKSAGSTPMLDTAGPVSTPEQRQDSRDDSDRKDMLTGKGSPKLDAFPTLPMRSPASHGVTLAHEKDRPRACRSISLGAVPATVPRMSATGRTSQQTKTRHMRSISLGAPPTSPPSHPIPPLPAYALDKVRPISKNRSGVHISRVSVASEEPAESPILVGSPILRMHEDQPSGSPSLEEVVADDQDATLKTVSNHQWQNPLPQGQRPATVSRVGQAGTAALKARLSVQSKTAHYSMASVEDLSLISEEQMDESPAKRITALKATGKTRKATDGTSSPKTKGSGEKPKVSTPRKVSRHPSVSADGSPVQRKRTPVLQDISNNSVTLSRQHSVSTLCSEQSSNGNPFQWDQPQQLSKPSALKGSPNARKGHKRQNCVRISTLTPQVLGPPPSRATSPSITHGIEEESVNGEDNSSTDDLGLRFVSNQRLSRSSLSSIGSHLRVQQRRTSLTPSSPTLSTWTPLNDHGSQTSGSDRSVSPATRSASSQSRRSPATRVSDSGSPTKLSPLGISSVQGVPQLSLSRPSREEEERDEPAAMKMDVYEDDSPTLPPEAPLGQEYDPAWAPCTFAQPGPSPEYDPASPSWGDMHREQSSPLFPFALSPRRQADAVVDIQPSSNDPSPISPRTTLGPTATITSKLTSANASSIMATLDTSKPLPPNPAFLNAPVLKPKLSDSSLTDSSSTFRWGSLSGGTSRTEDLSPMTEHAFMPLPLSTKTSPTGPRSQPGKSMLKTAQALRRMNSDAKTSRDRQSRVYARLGREPSPLLPYVGSLEPGAAEDRHEMFDFGFGNNNRSHSRSDHHYQDTKAGALVACDGELAMYEYSALDELDVTTQMDRRMEDGALAEFEPPRKESAASAASTATSTTQASVSAGSNVWEDGEQYWDQRQGMFVKKGAAVVVQQTPVNQQKMKRFSLENSARTARSLYDSDGFLRT